MIQAQYKQRGPIPQHVIEAVTLETPTPQTGEALIEVLAAPINPSDVLTLTGQYGILPPLPAVGGNEGVGRIAALGPETKGPAIGTTVLLPTGSGTWSTHIVAKAAKLVPLPGTDPQQLSMLTINPPTALLMLQQFVTLAKGDWVIQNAANSGVGGYIHQIAKVQGLQSIGIVRRESAVTAAKATGADIVLVDGDDLNKRVAEATGGAKIKLGIDAVGGGATERLAQCLATGGTIVNYGAMSGEPCHITPGSLIFRGISLRGFWLASWFRQSTPAEQMQVYGELTGMIASGQLHANVHATYPISQIKDAVAAAASGERDGKILLVPDHGK